jgi:uncharacterized membrane-anchored protein
MVVVWSGAGGALLFIFCISDLVCNFSLFLDYSADKFALINWWQPCLISAIAAWLLADYAQKLRANDGAGNPFIRGVLGTGAKDTLYWIPVQTWSFILLGIAVWQFIAK